MTPTIQQDAAASCKGKSLTRTSRRLAGWLKRRISRSSKPWIQVSLEGDFCKMAKVSLRTARRALNQLRDDCETQLIFRTIHERRRWVILASTPKRLHNLSRAEPLPQQTNGRARIIKTHKHGETIHQEQLRLGAEKVYWGNDRADDLEEKQETIVDDPRQQKLAFDVDDEAAPWSKLLLHAHKDEKLELARNWAAFFGVSVSDKKEALYYNKGVSFGNKDKHGWEPRFDKKALRKLAWYQIQRLKACHWDNVKVKYEPRFAFSYVLKHLLKGYDKDEIATAYNKALHQRHADAVDSGVTTTESWRASSTVSLASELLSTSRRRWTPLSGRKSGLAIKNTENIITS